MSNEFDFDPDFDLDDDFDEDLAEFDEFDDELDDVKLRTAVMQKNDMIALLCIKTASAGAAICRVDPREDRPAVQIYDDAGRGRRVVYPQPADQQTQWLERHL